MSCIKPRITDLDKTIGANIRFYRLERRWTQMHLADALTITFQQVQKYERGYNRIAASRLFQIADLLRVPMQAFREPRI